MTYPTHHSINQPARTSRSWESTHLNLLEDRYEYLLSAASNKEQSNQHQRGHGIKETGFNEHGDDGPAQSASSSPPQRSAGVPG